jgi:hypothetical protein
VINPSLPSFERVDPEEEQESHEKVAGYKYRWNLVLL